MAERVFVIQNASHFIFENHLNVSKCEIPAGLNGEWEVTDNGWVSTPNHLGKIVGENITKGDMCVFKFDITVRVSDRRKFRKGLLRALTDKYLTRS